MYDVNNTGPTPSDLGERIVFEKVLVPVPQLFEASAIATDRASIRNRRFTDCIIRGPAVIVPVGGTRFIDCNMGNVVGDARNLFLRPAGPMIIGGISFEDCIFERCLFFAVGLAGNDAYIDQFVKTLNESRKA